MALDALPSPCFLAGADGRLLWVNRAWRTSSGKPSLPQLDTATAKALSDGCRSQGAFELPLAVGEKERFVARVAEAADPQDPRIAWLGLCLPDPTAVPQPSARTFAAELGEQLRREHDPEALLHKVNRALGEHLGALRVGYGEIDPEECWLTLRSDWTAGVESNAGRFPLAAFGAGIVAENRAGRTFVATDVRNDPRIGPEHLEAFTRWGVGALVAVPLIKNGRFTAILSVQSATPRAWTGAEIALMEEIAERTWDALERAKAEERLLATQANQHFLLQLGDRLRRHASASDVLREAVEMLGRHLGANRVGYAEMDMAADVLSVDVDWVDGALPSIVGRYPLKSFGAANIAALAGGETVRIVDTDRSPFVDAENRPAMDAMQIRSAITVPLVKRERLVAVLSVQHGEPRDWTSAEVRLVEEVAERTWSTVERATAEASLRQSEERLRVAIEGAQLGTWDYDLLTQEGWWSPRTCEIYGIPYTGSIAPELRYTLVHPDDLDRYLEEVDEAVFAGRPFSIEYRIVRPDGELRWVILRGVVSTDQQGQPVRATGIALDTTDRNRAEAELARSREALHQSEKLTALGSLLAGVAHELNNPLAVVVANAALLEEDTEGTPYAADVVKIRRAAERCGKIVQTFLAMARQRPPERRLADVAAMVRSALELADYGLRTSGIAVTADLPPDLPPVEIDEGQIQQVFANLIVNAQQAMQDKQGERRLGIIACVDAEGMVRVEVTDSGLGIAPDIQHRIFEPFYTTKPQGSGTGIGLSYSLGVVEAHGGRLELVRSSAEGSAFAVKLPPAKALPHPTPATQDGAPAPPPRPATALVVDDEQDLLDALSAILRREGYNVLEARSGREAQEALAGRDVDLIVSDVRMPDLDGPGLFAWLRSERPALVERTVFLTGDTLGAEASRFLADTKRPFLEKPFTPAAVRELLKEIAR